MHHPQHPRHNRPAPQPADRPIAHAAPPANRRPLVALAALAALLLAALAMALFAGCGPDREAADPDAQPTWHERARAKLHALADAELPQGQVLVFFHRAKSLRLLKAQPADEGGVRLTLPASQLDRDAWNEAFLAFSEAGGNFAEPRNPSRVGRPGGPITALAATFDSPDDALAFIPELYRRLWRVEEPAAIEAAVIDAQYVDQAVVMDHIRNLDSPNALR